MASYGAATDGTCLCFASTDLPSGLTYDGNGDGGHDDVTDVLAGPDSVF